jgi:exonuclease SbcC
MLLKKIKTKGFLGHLSGEAENDFVELDFGDKNLWLIQGRNGAGKSTLFDAITMAFFKKHRGGATDFTNLIHDKASKAEIFVEFALHGNDYRIAVDVPKKSTVVRKIQFWNGVDWATQNDDIDDWVRRNLKISYDTFVSSVLLRQGEADRFILAKPTPRREIFLELLQLEFYKKLTERTKFRHKCASERLKEIKQSLEGLENPSVTDIKNQEKEVKRFGKELETFGKEKSEKNNEFENAKQAQKLSGQIKEIEAQQIRDQAIFEKAAQVEEKYSYFIELKENLVRIENVWREKSEIVKIEKDFEVNSQRFNQLKIELKTVSDNSIKLSFNFENAKKLADGVETQLVSAKASRDKLSQKLDEITRFEALESQIEQAIEKLNAVQKKVAEANEMLVELKGHSDNAVAEKDKIATDLQKCETDFQVWSDRLDNRRRVVDRDECPTCGNELKREETRRRLLDEFKEAEQKVDALMQSKSSLTADLAKAKKRFSEINEKLEASSGDYQKLLKTENEFDTQIKTLRAQITVIYKEEERKTIRRDFTETQNLATEFEEKFKQAKGEIDSLQQSVTELENSKIRFESESANIERNQADLQNRRQTAEENMAKAEIQISDKWRNHAALQDMAELENLRHEKTGLETVIKEYSDLSTARNRKKLLEDKKEWFTRQLEEIPVSNQREVSQVEAEFNEIIKRIGIIEDQSKNAENLLRKMTDDKKVYDEKSVEMKSVKEDVEIWKKLVKALGKDGLETKVVREAQMKISENANKTLKSLSNGKFEIRLEDSGKEMKIFVRDFTTGENRQVEYCSGGEKFLTAVSLAIAIGQSASGQNIANTLIIDEGFGALDDKNRVLMVNELSRLTDIFLNGRIIIVSHQDDVQENFANRYRLSKSNEGFTSVETGAIL